MRSICAKLVIGMMPGHDRAGDAGLARALDEVEVERVVEEELRDEELRAGVDLAPACAARSSSRAVGLDVPLGVAGAAEAEAVSRARG